MGIFFSGLVYLVFCMLLVLVWLCLFLSLGIFSFMILLKVFLPHLGLYFKGLGFSWCPTFPVGCFSGFCSLYGDLCLIHLTSSECAVSVSLVKSVLKPWVALVIPSAFCGGFFGHHSDIFSLSCFFLFSPISLHCLWLLKILEFSDEV